MVDACVLLCVAGYQIHEYHACAFILVHSYTAAISHRITPPPVYFYAAEVKDGCKTLGFDHTALVCGYSGDRRAVLTHPFYSERSNREKLRGEVWGERGKEPAYSLSLAASLRKRGAQPGAAPPGASPHSGGFAHHHIPTPAAARSPDQYLPCPESDAGESQMGLLGTFLPITAEGGEGGGCLLCVPPHLSLQSGETYVMLCKAVGAAAVDGEGWEGGSKLIANLTSPC